MSTESEKVKEDLKKLTNAYRGEIGKKIIIIQTLEKHNKILKEQITRNNEKCDGLEEEISRLNSILTLHNTGSLNPDPNKIKVTDKDRRALQIQGKEKKKVRDRKVQERQGEYYK